MSKQLETQYIPIEDLKVWGKNPRLHNLDSIVESIKEFGFRDPISINANNQEIEEGHGRLKALKKLKDSGNEPPAFIIKENGTWLVPVQRFNDSELNQKRYSIAHNRTQELGEYDEPLLLENLVDLKDDLFATGYTSEDIDLLNENCEIKDELNNYKYKPFLEPGQANRQVNDSDIEKTSARLENQMIKEQNKRTVICPNCLEEFKIDD